MRRTDDGRSAICGNANHEYWEQRAIWRMLGSARVSRIACLGNSIQAEQVQPAQPCAIAFGDEMWSCQAAGELDESDTCWGAVLLKSVKLMVQAPQSSGNPSYWNRDLQISPQSRPRKASSAVLWPSRIRAEPSPGASETSGAQLGQSRIIA